MIGWGVRGELRFDQHRLPFPFAALREPGGQAFGKLLGSKTEADFELSIGDGQSVVKIGRIGEVAHAELVQPFQRARAPLATNYYVNQKLLRVHGISLALSRGRKPYLAIRRLSTSGLKTCRLATLLSDAVKIIAGVAHVRVRFLFALSVCALLVRAPITRAQAANSPTLQVESWRRAILAGDVNALASMYTEGARIFGPKQTPSNLKSALDYWTSWKAKGLKSVSAEVDSQQEQGAFHVVTMELTLAVAENGATRKYYVKVAQGYVEQGTTWKIAAEQRDRETRLKGPAERKDLYPAGVDAQKEIAQALLTAAKEHKRVLLVFGGNWCYDCHVLDEAFHSPEIAPTVNHNFVVVHIDIGEYNRNLDLAKKYEIPLERGVPAAAVLDSEGKLIVSQKNQEFEKAQSMAPEDILAFLNKWKPPNH